MSEEKLDPRIVRTKEAIQTVFKQMVCELPYEKITVKAITEAARINRNTFYLHYNCVDDVLAEIQAKHSSEYSAIVSGFDQLKDTDKLVRSFFEYMEAQDEFFKRVTCDSRFDYIREGMQKKSFGTHPSADKKTPWQKHLYPEYRKGLFNIGSYSLSPVGF